MVNLDKKSPDPPEGNWWQRIRTRTKLLAVIVPILAGGVAIAGEVKDWEIDFLGEFTVFREIVQIAVRGESLPSLQTRWAVYKELLEEERTKTRPDPARIRELKFLMKQVEEKIKRLGVLRSKYPHRR